MAKLSEKTKAVITKTLYCLIAPAFIFYVLSLAGCVSKSPGVPKLHLLEISVDDKKSIRIGYYGICALASSNIICVPTSFTSEPKIIDDIRDFWGTDKVTDETIKFALQIQNKAFLNVFVIGFVLFLLGTIFELYRTLRKPVKPTSIRRHKLYRRYALACVLTGSVFTFAAAVANNQLGRAAEIITDGEASLGQASCVLHWISWAASLIIGAGWAMSLQFTSSKAQDGTTSKSITPPAPANPSPV